MHVTDLYIITLFNTLWFLIECNILAIEKEQKLQEHCMRKEPFIFIYNEKLSLVYITQFYITWYHDFTPLH